MRDLAGQPRSFAPFAPYVVRRAGRALACALALAALAGGSLLGASVGTRGTRPHHNALPALQPSSSRANARATSAHGPRVQAAAPRRAPLTTHATSVRDKQSRSPLHAGKAPFPKASGRASRPASRLTSAKGSSRRGVAETRETRSSRRGANARSIAAGRGSARAPMLRARRETAVVPGARFFSRRAVSLSAAARPLPLYDELPEDNPAPGAQLPALRASAPSAAVRSLGSLPVVSASAPLAVRRPSLMSQRIEGFGAEGAPLANSGSATLGLKANPASPLASVPGQGGVTPSRGLPSPELVALARPPATVLTREAVRPLILPALYGADGRLVVPAALRGSREVLVHQNLMADQAGLERLRDDEHLRRLFATHQLVAFSESASLRLNPGLPPLRRTARPWTVHFAEDAARTFYDRFHQPLQLNSAVRSVAYQLRLQRSNGNAAAIDGEAASPHLTGQAIDFGKRGMTLAQIAWMRSFLLPFITAGQIDVEEEFQQACFHISVYRSYVPLAPAPRLELAQAPSAASGAARQPRAPLAEGTSTPVLDPSPGPAAVPSANPAAIAPFAPAPNVIER